MSNSEDTSKLHLKYWIFILTLCIIAIATDRWTVQKDFTVYLSNAATMTSLLLGLVAIFYSFISNDGLSKSLGSITTVADEVGETRHQIEKYLAQTKEATDLSSENASLLKVASGDVTFALTSLSATLKEITEQNSSLQDLVSALPTRFDQLESKFVGVAASIGEKPAPLVEVATTSSREISSEAISHFLVRTSLSYNLLSYACVLAYQTKQSLKIEDVNSTLGLNMAAPMVGFLACMDATGLVSRKMSRTQARVYTIESVHPELERTVKSYYTDYVNITYDGNLQEQWLMKLLKIEQLFV